MLPTRMTSLAGMVEGAAGLVGGGGICLLAQEELLHYPQRLHPHLC